MPSSGMLPSALSTRYALTSLILPLARKCATSARGGAGEVSEIIVGGPGAGLDQPQRRWR